ncbi:hypothetical protein [Floricoccus penangensis]|uniref:hypothetical protein n=1 Tax=Floricoccus penangensis TaxID=1859475 RepID=UPI002040882F|nr:hypothetical protein [Floricoccus penangensis]URZ86983.1 hypothetical protein KIW23_07820 [Floricoccus penangensis]
MWIYTKIRFFTVTGRTTFSRLEFIKISLQLLGIILTFIVFQNTLAIQKANKSERNADKVKSDREKNYKMVHDDFLMLLDNIKRMKYELKNETYPQKPIKDYNEFLCRKTGILKKETEFMSLNADFVSYFPSNDNMRSKYRNFMKSIEQIILLLDHSSSSGHITDEQKNFFLNLLITNLSESELTLIAYSCILDSSFFELFLKMRKNYIFDNIEDLGSFTVRLFGKIESKIVTSNNNTEDFDYCEYDIFYGAVFHNDENGRIYEIPKVFNNLIIIEKFLKGEELSSIEDKIVEEKGVLSLYSTISNLDYSIKDDLDYFSEQ